MHRLPLNLDRTARRAFTLLELMISIAIVLLLMLGINFVFSMSSRTISTGMALMNVNRDLRAARTVMQTDFDNAVNAAEMPALIIHSQYVDAFLNRQDELTDSNGNPTDFTVDDADDTDLNTPQYAGLFNFRRHRIDRISIFTRNRSGDYRRQTGNDDTYLAGDNSDEAWIQYGFLKEANENWDPATFRWPGGSDPSDFNDANDAKYASQWLLGRSQTLLVRQTTTPGKLMAPAAMTGLPANWHGLDGNSGLNYLRTAKPFTVRKDIDTAVMSAEMALATPIFIRGCTQFIVEFAGDFWDQGTATVAEPVGTVDYEDSPTGGTRIRWYGFPRDADGDGVLDVNPVIAYPPVLSTAPTPRSRWDNSGPISFEHSGTGAADGAGIWAWGPIGDESERPRPEPAQIGPPFVASVQGHPYTVRPSLVRIIIEATDQNNRLQDSQRMEMIFRLPDLVRSY